MAGVEGFWMVRVDEDIALRGVGELWPREFRRARTFGCIDRREDDRPSRSAARLMAVGGAEWGSSGEALGGRELRAP